MATVLFLAHRIPYPPNKGDKIRSWNFLKRLGEHHRVHVGFYVDSKRDMEHIPRLREMFASVEFVEVSPLWQKVRSLLGLITGKSLTESAYPFGELRRYYEELKSKEKIDCIVLFSAATAPIVLPVEDSRLITDLVDVDSEKWRSYSKQSSWPFSWIYEREARKLSQFEADLADASDVSLLVSQDEVEVFKRRNSHVADKVVSVRNGVDINQFNPALFPNSQEVGRVLFSGAMDYQPNLEAVEWFVENVWTQIRQAHENAIFVIAGGPFTSRTKKLERVEGVTVLGYVDDMAETIATAQVVVAPLQTARGIQNKVLEALSMAKPVVATSLANEGINAVDGKELLVADEAGQFAEHVNSLLSGQTNCETYREAGRALVVRNFSWERSFEELNQMITVR